MNTLVLNAGSSSIKYQLFTMPEERVLASGAVEQIGESTGRTVFTVGEDRRVHKRPIRDHREGLELISQQLLDPEHGVIRQPEDMAAVGHRVVHGGEQFRNATLITDEVLQTIEALTPLAPLHNPPNLRGIRVAQEVFPQARQVAVFDTAFHQTLPDYAFRYPVPDWLYREHHVRVYGMHGTSHRYVAEAAARYLDRPLGELNLITVHLGNGCSMTAVQNGQSIDTSMGLTPLAGLMMGTRSGDIDPALGYFLQREANLDAEAVDRLLNKESGLKGIAGDNDLRTVIQRYEAGDKAARLALKMYTYRIKKYLGAYTAVLSALDAVVFTAGVGENSALVRQMSCSGLTHLDITVDEAKNTASAKEVREIQADDSLVKVLVVPTNEERAIAQQTYRVVRY